MPSTAAYVGVAKRFDSGSLRLMWAGFVGILVWGTIASVLCAAVTLIAAALGLLELARGYPLLVMLAFLLGAGGSALVTGAHGLLADLNPEHRAAALNLLDVFFGVGAFVTAFAIVPLQR